MYNNSFDPKEGSTENESAEAVEESNGPVTAPLTEEFYEDEPVEEAAVEE